MYHSSSKPASFILVVVAALALTGCDRSLDEKHEEIVKCSGFSTVLMNTVSSSSLMSATDALLTKDGVRGSDIPPLGAAGLQYAATMDPAKVARLVQEGSSAAKGVLDKNDASSIAEFLKSCVFTYRELGK